MKRKLLIALLVLSILVLFAVPLFILFVWSAGILVGSIFTASTGGQLSETLAGPFTDFVGSPLFYVQLGAGLCVLLSSVLLIVTRKR